MEENKLKEFLKSVKNAHLMCFWDELNETQKSELEKDILDTNFSDIKEYFKTENIVKKDAIIEPLYGKAKEDFEVEEKTKLENIGKDIIKNGKYAVVTMAGGQGTRLGHTGPKGTFKLNLKGKDTYIFELFIEKLKVAFSKYGVYIDWYLMTSKENHKETVEFFETHDYFGYPKENIKFFSQGELPITDLQGNVVLESKSKIKKAADGNGGVFNALGSNKIIDDMKNKGVEWVLITGIDNILVNLADELFIGHVSQEGKMNGVKSVGKSGPYEKVGVFCKRDNKPSVIEYMEMTDEMLNAKDNTGNLLYKEANIVNHLLHIDVLEKIKNEKLPIHKAIKKINYIDTNGNFVEPTEPCLIKYEAFIFDYFTKVQDVSIFRVKREEEFAPVKNKEGVDSPETATKLYNNLYFKGE